MSEDWRGTTRQMGYVQNPEGTVSVWRDDSQQRRDEIMHWLRANGVTEPADRIGDSAYSRGNTWLYYETVEGGPPVDHGGPWKRWHRVELRVPFADAMRDYRYREQYR